MQLETHRTRRFFLRSPGSTCRPLSQTSPEILRNRLADQRELSDSCSSSAYFEFVIESELKVRAHVSLEQAVERFLNVFTDAVLAKALALQFQNHHGIKTLDARREIIEFALFFKRRILRPNTSADTTCDELVCKQTIYAMKKGMILSAALSVVALMLVSCAGEPEAQSE